MALQDSEPDNIFFDKDGQVRIAPPDVAEEAKAFTDNCGTFITAVEGFSKELQTLLDAINNLTASIDEAKARATGYKIRLDRQARDQNESISQAKRKLAARTRELELVEAELESLRAEEGI